MQVEHRAPRSLARDFTSVFSANIGIIIVGLVTGAITARVLGPAGRGSLAIVMFWPAFVASLASLSIPEAMAFQASRDSTSTSEVRSSGCVLLVIMGITVGLSVALLVPWLLGQERSGLWRLAAVYALLFVPFHYLWQGSAAIALGRLRLRRHNLIRFSIPAIYLLGLLGLLLVGLVDVNSAAFANLIAVGLVAVSSLRLWRIQAASLTRIRQLLTNGVAFHGAAGLSIAVSQLDRVIGYRIFEDATVGHYAVAVTVASVLPLILASSLHTVLFPTIAGKDVSEGLRLIERAGRATMLAMVIIAALVVVVGPAFIRAVYGPEFGPAGGYAQVLVLGFGAVGIKQVLVRSLRAIGEAGIGTFAEVLSFGATALIAFSLAPSMGPVGLAIAIGSGACLAIVVILWHLVRVHGLSPHSLWGLNLRTAREIAHAVSIRWRQGL